MRTSSEIVFGHDAAVSSATQPQVTILKSATNTALDILRAEDSRKARIDCVDRDFNTVQNVKPSFYREQRTLRFDQLPAWMKLDPRIRRGYRFPTGRVSDCLISLFYAHNELVNTWSHLAPAVFFVVLLAGMGPRWMGLTEFEQPNQMDWVMMQVYFVCTALCLLLSAGFHCLNCHSQPMAQRTLKLDYLGIVLTISSTAITSTYFGLYDRPDLQRVYISCILVCGATVLWTALAPDMDGVDRAAWRAAIFIALGASGFGAIVHVALTEGQEGLVRFPLLHIGLTCSCYLFGAFLYVKRFPESRWPETFDIWGASHQLFHTLVAIGQLIFLYGLKDCFWMHHR